MANSMIKKVNILVNNIFIMEDLKKVKRMDKVL